MSKNTIMFGSIGAVAETSDIQRRAYNQALKEAGLDWQWSAETYSELLRQSGGKERLEMLAAATGVTLTPEQIEKIHARKTEIACEELVHQRVTLRPGIAQLLELGKSRGMKMAFVTTTYEPNIEAIFTALGDEMNRADFDAVVTRNEVANGKPAPDAYETALRKLGVSASDAIAIEDTAASVMSAKRAGLDVIATPGALTAGQDFWQADLVLETLLDGSGALDSRVTAYLN